MSKELRATSSMDQHIVLEDVPDYALMVGNPAKLKGWMCVCGIQLAFKGDKAKCMACKRRYKKIERGKITEIW